jgi:hypothetical protein
MYGSLPYLQEPAIVLYLPPPPVIKFGLFINHIEECIYAEGFYTPVIGIYWRRKASFPGNINSYKLYIDMEGASCPVIVRFITFISDISEHIDVGWLHAMVTGVLVLL